VSNHSLVVFYDSEVPEDFFKDFLRDVKGANLPVETRTITVGPMMALEWLLPTTVIVCLAKPFLDVFLKRAADDVADVVYPKIKNAITKLVIKVLVSTRGSWRRITTSGELPREGRSAFFSIESETKEATRIKFVFNEGDSEEQYEACLDQALQLLQAHHTESPHDPFLDAPVDEDRNTIYMLYDEDQQRWYAANIYEEIRKIAAESRGKSSNSHKNEP